MENILEIDEFDEIDDIQEIEEVENEDQKEEICITKSTKHIIPAYNDTIKKQLEEMVEIPAVLMSRQDEPYEYREIEGSKARFKRKRQIKKLPFQLYNFVVQNNIQKSQLREFASGLFLNYIDASSNYM